MKKLIQKTLRILESISWLPPLLARVTLGLVFLSSGWGKLNHLSKVIEYFTELGIPFATAQAPFVATVELVCGGLLLIGVFTRVVALPLIGTMVVAILTARRSEIHSLSELFGIIEYVYILLLFWLATAGGGALSLDRVIPGLKKF